MLLTLRTTNTHGNARSTADAVITALSPAAWYRNATDVVSSGGFASIWADYASTAQGLVLPGVNANGASSPDSAALDFAGSFEIAVRVKLPDYTPAAQGILVAKDDPATSRNYHLALNAAGTLQFYNGTDILTSSAATGITDGDAAWIRVTFNATGFKCNFYTAADSATFPSSWTQLGVERTGTALAAVGTADLTVGMLDGAGTSPLTGTVLRAVLKDGIDGTTVFDADFSAQAIGAASFTESSSNAATVTINASGAAPAHIGKARDLLQGTGTNQPAYAAGVFTFDGADNYLKTSAFTLNQALTAVFVGKLITWTANDTVFDGVNANRAILYQITATPNISLYAGSGPVANNTNLVLNTRGIVVAVFNGASSSTRVNDTAKATGNAGAQGLDGLTLGARGGVVASFANMTVEEFILFPSALSDANQDAVITALNNALTVF